MLVLKDFSTSILAAPLSAAATSIAVGDASRFPALPVGSYFYAVLQKFADRHQVEIVKVVGVSGNTFSVERAQAGTVAGNFSVGDYIELRLTVGTFDEYIRQSVAGKIDSANGVAYQTLLFENAGDGVRSSFGVRFSDHHETVIGGAEGVNAVAPSLHLRPLGRDNKTVEALYTHDGVFRLVGGASEIAARRIILNSPDATGWPSGAASSADNYARQWRSVVQANNSSLYLVGDGTLNARRFGFQVGNADPALSHEVGVLELNPYGGDVRINGGMVYHTNFRPTPAAIGAMPVQGSVNFDWTGVGSTLPSHFFHHVFSDSDPSVYVHAYTGLAGASTTSYRIRTNNADISSYDEHLFNRNGAYFNGQRYFHEGFLPTLSALGAYPLKGGQLDGHMLAKAYVIAESPDGQNWVGMESVDGDVKPYISAKVNNVARKVMEFNFDGSISLPTTLHAQRINAAVWGDVFNAIGGTLRSDNAAVMSLDGKTYSFVTSPSDAHLCQNSYWDGAEWRKYDVNSVSGHLFVAQGNLRFSSSEAGNVDPNQNRYYVYHTGFKPTLDELGAAAVVDNKIVIPNGFAGGAGGTLKNQKLSGNLETWMTTRPDSDNTHHAIGVGEDDGPKYWDGTTRKRIYHEGWKPTAADVGALPTIGGTITGNVFLPDQNSMLNVTNGAKIRYYRGNSTWFYTSVNGAGEFEISAGVEGETSLATIDYTGKMRTSNQGILYGDRSKPTAHDIGAAPAGFGVGDYGAMISTVLGDCNLRRQGGFFQGSYIEGIPSDGHSWKYVINTCHANAAGFFGYIAMDFDLNHAWLGGQTGGGQKLRKFVFQNDRIVTGGASGNDFHQGAIEVNGNGDAKPTIGFHQMGQFAASIGLWFGDQFRFHTQGVGDYAGIMTGLANVSDVYIRSDVRLKTNFVEMRGALDKLSLLQAYYYDKKGMLSSDDYNAHELGLKAQDVEAVEPVAVRRVEDSSGGEILSISGSAINAMLVQAINELRIRVEELERHARS